MRFRDTSAIYGPIVTTTNDVWVIDDLPVNPSFQKLLETLYHEKLNLVDFVNKHEEHLNTIAPLTSLSPSPLPKHRCYPSKPAHVAECMFEIVGGGNATGYATGTFVEQGMADGRLSIVSKEVI
ncbi:serpin-ZX-like [Cucumis melo var. makuwa]|uniref:Serpin-ZX-like n=1 Tax=Cucumis melo var. makuwa TaxID=1194695 RepID=A0A5A7VQX8_CUCMM|nr:serpin-ZX-like [Cucumis melo var. makuwa]TYK22410.1 serpin-ZX-like [Cucumis melo var. makuwa]